MTLTARLPIDLTVYGQVITGIKIPIGSSVDWTFNCEDPTTRAPIPLTDEGIGIVMGVCAIDVRNRPLQPVIFAHQATIEDAPNGVALVPWSVADTVPTVNEEPAPLPPGFYYCDLWITDADGNRLALLAQLYIELTAVATLPTTLVTPVPGQPPLGQGPAGPPGDGAIRFIHPIAGGEESDFEIAFVDETDINGHAVPVQPNALYTVRVSVVTDDEELFIFLPGYIVPRSDQSTGGFRVLLGADQPIGAKLLFEVTANA